MLFTTITTSDPHIIGTLATSSTLHIILAVHVIHKCLASLLAYQTKCMLHEMLSIVVSEFT